MDTDIFLLNKFRKIKDNSYKNKATCDSYAFKYGQKFENKYITNPRFKGFDQTYFNAGDFQDINKYGLLPVRYIYSEKDKSEKDKSEKEKAHKIFKLYKSIDYHSVANTFSYMFNKFKKGIFIVIHNNQLLVFLPFSNVYYKNNVRCH